MPKNRHSNLKQVEEALDTMIATEEKPARCRSRWTYRPNCSPKSCTPARRRLHRAGIQTTRQIRRESREFDQRWKLRQNLLAQAETDLNFQSPETVCTWYTRWSDEFDAGELAGAFWRWQTRFASLKEMNCCA